MVAEALHKRHKAPAVAGERHLKGGIRPSPLVMGLSGWLVKWINAFLVTVVIAIMNKLRAATKNNSNQIRLTRVYTEATRLRLRKREISHSGRMKVYEIWQIL